LGPPQRLGSLHRAPGAGFGCQRRQWKLESCMIDVGRARHYRMTNDPTALAKLDELLASIRTYTDPRRATDEWKQAYKLLQKTHLPSGRVSGIVGMRDVGRLAGLIEELRTPPPPPAPVEAIDPEVLRKAMVAFRSRLAVTVLDEESKLGRSPLTKGPGAGVPAIIPPNEWPAAVWQELARQGKLRYIGHGFYELGKQ
jgi:hypothetical protein